MRYMQLSAFPALVPPSLTDNDVPPSDGEHVVYVGMHASGWWKIGTTSLDQLQKRMRRLKIKPILLLAGSYPLERRLHRRFATLRMAGEWFRPTPELWDFVRSAQAVGGGDDVIEWLGGDAA